MLRRIAATLLLMLIGSGMLTVNAQDGIPDNCEYSGGEHDRPNLFPRFELQNNRLVLVDWSTGQDVQVLDAANGAGVILGWSADCRYLAAAVGSYADSDTVVYDTVSNTRVGSVDDAQGQPHHITWGVSNYLIVETRNGAILWNVPANTQTTLTTSYDAYSARNFSRLRWDAEHLQVVANLAVGGRVVYDLTTGQEIDLAASVNPDLDTETVGATVNIGGRLYGCGRGGVQGVWIRTQGGLSLARGHRNNPEILQVIEPEFSRPRSLWNFARWSANCRYFSLAVSSGEPSVLNTVVWDIIENRRIAVFEDAREIPHPLSWSPVDNIMLIETRHGAYLWDVATDTRTLINPNVEISLSGQRFVRSFRSTRWDAARGWLFGVPVQQQNAAYAYDIRTGELVRSYVVDETDEPMLIHYSSNATQIVLRQENDYRAFVSFNIDTGERIPETPSVPASQPNAYERQSIPGTTVPVNGESGFGASGESSYYSWNHLLPYRGCLSDSQILYTQDRQLVISRRGTGEIVQVIERDLNDTYGMFLSPDCRYVAAQVNTTSNAPVPYEQSPIDAVSPYGSSETFVIWDIATGERVMELPHPYRGETYPRVIWSPDSNWAFVRTSVAQWVVNLATQTSTVLYGDTIDSTYTAIQPYPTVYWDFTRGQMLVSGRTGVYAHDLYTGEMRYVFAVYPEYDLVVDWYSRIRFVVDATAENLYLLTPDRLTIWNLDTYSYTHVDLGARAFTWRSSDRLAVSPDGRYFVLARAQLLVWDLFNLPDELEMRDPVRTFNGPAGYIRSIRFIDNVSVETVSSDGIFRWNVETGEQLE